MSREPRSLGPRRIRAVTATGFALVRSEVLASNVLSGASRRARTARARAAAILGFAGLAAGIKLKDFAARSSRVPVAERFPASNMEN